MISKQYCPIGKSIYYSCFAKDNKHFLLYKTNVKCYYDNLFVLPIPSKHDLIEDNIVKIHQKDLDKYLLSIKEKEEVKSKYIFKPIVQEKRIGKDTYNKPIPWTDIIIVNKHKDLLNYFSETMINLLAKKYPDWKFIVGSVKKSVEPGLVALLYEPKFSTTLFYPCLEASEQSPNLVNSVENPDTLVDRNCSIIAGNQTNNMFDLNPKILRLNHFTKNNDIWLKKENILETNCIFNGI